MDDSIIFQIGCMRTGQDRTECLHFLFYNMPLEVWKCQKIYPDYKKIAKENKDTYWNQNNSDPRRTPPAVNVDNRTAVSITNTPHKWQLEDLCQCQSFLLMLDLKCKWDNLTYPALSRTGTKMSSFAKRWWRDPSPAESLLQNGSQWQAARLKCSSKLQSPKVRRDSISPICSHCTHFKGAVQQFKSGTVPIT